MNYYRKKLFRAVTSFIGMKKFYGQPVSVNLDAPAHKFTDHRKVEKTIVNSHLTREKQITVLTRLHNLKQMANFYQVLLPVSKPPK